MLTMARLTEREWSTRRQLNGNDNCGNKSGIILELLNKYKIMWKAVKRNKELCGNCECGKLLKNMKSSDKKYYLSTVAFSSH